MGLSCRKMTNHVLPTPPPCSQEEAAGTLKPAANKKHLADRRSAFYSQGLKAADVRIFFFKSILKFVGENVWELL